MHRRRLFASLAASAIVTALPFAAIASAVATHAWARPGFDNVAVYLRLTNTGDRPLTLVGARAAIARSVVIHQSMQMQGGGESGMTMTTVDDLTVEPHQEIVFAPGGYHLMLTGMRHALKLGQRFPIVLLFRDNTREIVPVTVTNP